MSKASKDFSSIFDQTGNEILSGYRKLKSIHDRSVKAMGRVNKHFIETASTNCVNLKKNK